MKKIVKMFVLTAMLFFGGQAMAQYRGALFLGATFPMDDFGDFDGLSDFALMSTDMDDDDAGAAIGVNAGIKLYFNVGVKDLDVMLSVDGFYNGPCSELKATYQSKEGEIGGQWVSGSFTYETTPKFINVPAMLGLNYVLHINPSFGVYVEAGAGGNFRFITDLESVTTGQLLGIETKIRDTQSYDMAFGFAYQAGLGLTVGKNLMIGCSFYDLGKAQVTGQQTVKHIRLNDDIVTTDHYYNKFGTVHPMMIVGRIAFNF